MKHRWIGGALLASALTLGACAPETQGGQETDSASPTVAPTPGASPDEPTAAPTATPAATETAAPTPYDYEY